MQDSAKGLIFLLRLVTFCSKLLESKAKKRAMTALWSYVSVNKGVDTTPVLFPLPPALTFSPRKPKTLTNLQSPVRNFMKIVDFLLSRL